MSDTGDKQQDGVPDAEQALAVARLHEAAENDNAEALYRLGVMYGNADAVPLDRARGAAYFMRAAALGHEAACISLAWMYANGAGVETDESRARDLYEIAARHGSAKAQYVVGNMYRFAQYGVEKDIATALAWYQKAAAQNMPTAQFALGRLSMEGKVVARDDATALHWFMLAHVNGSKKAEDYIEQLVKRMPAEQVRAIRDGFKPG